MNIGQKAIAIAASVITTVLGYMLGPAHAGILISNVTYCLSCLHALFA